MAFSRLPPELLLLILSDLDAIDIHHLQLACKALYEVIEASGTHVWRQLLQRHCVRNDLFTPSYAHLNTAAEVKHAATAPFRLASAYKKAAFHGTAIGKSTTLLQFPEGFLDSDEDAFPEMLFIPGGRYLLILLSGSLSLWDLRHAPNVELVLEEVLGPGDLFDSVAYLNCVDNTIQIICLFNDNLPPGYVSPAAGGDDVPITTYHFIELHWAADHTFTFNIRGKLTLVNASPSQIKLCSVVGNRIISRVEYKVLVWDCHNNSYTGWNYL